MVHKIKKGVKLESCASFPEVRACGPENWEIASGMSCRHQIKDGTEHRALHLAEALVMQCAENLLIKN